MEKITIRPAKEEDFLAIKGLISSGQINPMGLEWQRFLVAVNSQNDVIACGQIKPHRDGSIELASLVVAKEWRNLGIASVIIKKLIEGQTQDLYLMCQSKLGSIYEKFGFVGITESEMPKYFRRISKLAGFVEPLRKRGLTLLVMKKEI